MTETASEVAMASAFVAAIEAACILEQRPAEAGDRKDCGLRAEAAT